MNKPSCIPSFLVIVTFVFLASSAVGQTWEVFDNDYKLLRKIENGNLSYLGNSLRVNTLNSHISLLSQDYESFITIENTKLVRFMEPWIIISKGDKQGALHEYGDLVFPPEYDQIESFFNILMGKKGSMYSVYDRGTKQTRTYGPYETARLASNGQLIAKTPQGYLLPFSQDPDRLYMDLTDVSGNVIIAKEPTGYGLINRDGDYILDPIIDTMEYLGDNHFFAHDGNQYMLIKAQTNTADIKYTSYHRIAMENGVLLEYIHGRLRRIMKGDGILLDVVGMTEVKPVEGNHYNVFFRDQKIGLLNPNGKWDVQPSLNIRELLPGNQGLFGALINGKYGFVNSSGQVVIPAQFDEVKRFSDGLAAVRTGFTWGFVNLNGDLVVTSRYDRVGDFFRGMAIVLMSGKFNLIDREGKELLPEFYDRISLTTDAYYLTERNGSYGMINPIGVEIAPPIFEEIRREEFDRILVRYQGRYGIMRENGDFSLPLYYTSILFDESNKKILARHQESLMQETPDIGKKRPQRRPR
ncbi:WG repeat-containing protein [Lunatimonas lonarensis]|uniref:WG repeat-containing protein n=1 Tax=Lunatimonas lonarensis TaxID=1232681 RepID=UPI0005648F2D|nr:WG repeat-containing protein [Lunatimonas lonarensis]